MAASHGYIGYILEYGVILECSFLSTLFPCSSIELSIINMVLRGTISLGPFILQRLGLSGLISNKQMFTFYSDSCLVLNICNIVVFYSIQSSSVWYNEHILGLCEMSYHDLHIVSNQSG